MNRVVSSFLAAGAVMVLFAIAPAVADRGQETDLMPLQEWIKLPEKQRTPVYLLTRCAGLYTSIIEYGGANGLGVDTVIKLHNKSTVLMAAAIQRSLEISKKNIEDMKVTKDVAFKGITTVIENDVTRISGLYLKRAQNNSARRGEAWASDPLFKSDIEICNGLLQ